MRFLIIDTVYASFIHWLYRTRPELTGRRFSEQLEATSRGGFHTTNTWSPPLRAAGHEVFDVWADHGPLQLQWCAENGLAALPLNSADAVRLGSYVIELAPSEPWFIPIVREQIRAFKPDVLWVGDLNIFDSAFLESVRGSYRLAVGQHASHLPDKDLSGYDVIVSGGLTYVKQFQECGLKCELLLHAFNNHVLERLGPSRKIHDLTFIGQLGSQHKGRRMLMERIGRHIPLEVWGEPSWSAEQLADSMLSAHPPVFGIPMYETIQNSKMSINCHIDGNGDFATNQRLYEITGVGTLMLTEWMSNLPELFEVGKEVLAYRSAEECADLARFYLANDKARETIAGAGHVRTMRDHTVYNRVKDILRIVQDYMP
ncbi:MAG: glycosyltransferase [Alphaproteobacteria bacterium]|nr:glycosyltransferase [Alphaproteobacteria bacterium]